MRISEVLLIITREEGVCDLNYVFYFFHKISLLCTFACQLYERCMCMYAVKCCGRFLASFSWLVYNIFQPHQHLYSHYSFVSMALDKTPKTTYFWHSTASRSQVL